MLAGYLAERLRATGGALEVATRRYTEAERLAELGRIAAWLAHEIRNPLGSISGSVETARAMRPRSRPRTEKLCDIVSREVTRLNDLVGDMLDLSEAARRRVRARGRAHPSRARSSSSRRGRRPSAPPPCATTGPADEPAFATCDGAQMRQVLWNLVRNALQASPAGSEVHVRVEVEAERCPVSPSTTTGPGIDDEAKERIFDAFYTTRSHGAGIGLAVVKRIIDDHRKLGASIGVSNAPSGGARFQVTLRRDGVSRRSLASHPA